MFLNLKFFKVIEVRSFVLQFNFTQMKTDAN